MEGTLEMLGASASFVKLAWMSEEWRHNSKLWETGSFDVCKNTTVPIAAMLGHPELDTEVSDAGIETTESNNCKRMSESDENANGVLAVI